MIKLVGKINRRCCPMCDNRGFKRVKHDPYSRKTLVECNYCHHQWNTFGSVTDKRKDVPDGKGTIYCY